MKNLLLLLAFSIASCSTQETKGDRLEREYQELKKRNQITKDSIDTEIKKLK